MKNKKGFIIFFIIGFILIAIVIDYVVLSSNNLPDWFKLWFIFK